MARRKRLAGAAQRWAGDAESVWTGMADWRAAHPKATLSEIEEALDERLNQVRARVLADLALASAAADVAGAVRRGAAPLRAVWGGAAGAGTERAEAADAGRGRGAAAAVVRDLSHLRGRGFSPWMMNWGCCRAG